jgi:hypothetical protein
MEILGHARIDITMEIYTGPTMAADGRRWHADQAERAFRNPSGLTVAVTFAVNQAG